MVFISIVIPCYNVANYIAECIDAIMKQDYKNFEIICIDNNSTDGTLEVLNQISHQYNDKITVLTEKEKGAPAARNKGLMNAKGDYIQFLDADDLLLHAKLFNQVKLIEEQNSPDLIVADYYRQNTKGEKKLHRVNYDDVWLGLLYTQLGITSANLFKTEAVKKAGGFKLDLKSSQEYDLMFSILRNNGRTAHDKTAQVIIRDRESGSISLQNIEQNLLRYLDLRKAIIKHLSSQKSESEMIIYYQALFDTIRMLYKHNREVALSNFRSEMPKNFVPQPSAATTSMYIVFYKLFGFAGAEKVKSLIK